MISFLDPPKSKYQGKVKHAGNLLREMSERERKQVRSLRNLKVPSDYNANLTPNEGERMEDWM